MAESASAQDKTEVATPKKRSDARKKGEVSQSKEVVSMVILATAMFSILSWQGKEIAVAVATQSRLLWSGQQVLPDSLADYHALVLFHGAQVAIAVLPFLIVILIAGVLGNVMQIGFLFTFEALGFKASRISLLKGFKRFVSIDRIFDLGKSLVKMIVAGSAVWMVLEPSMGQVLLLSKLGLWQGLEMAGELIEVIAYVILVSFSAFALIDFFYTRWRFEKKLRMTKQEVRDEAKQREGDPKLKQQIKTKQRELSRMRMIADVSTADVVITNPTHFAVALRYDRQAMSAPTVVAKGRNLLAARIREEAKKHRVPIVENPPLAQLLYKTGTLNREIPDGLFKAVAEVLAYITRLDPRRADQWKAAS